jgi:hypothetical protein
LESPTIAVMAPIPNLPYVSLPDAFMSVARTSDDAREVEVCSGDEWRVCSFG